MRTKARVMIVDDDDDLLAELAEVLAGAGYEAVPCSDGSRAARTALRIDPDVIVIDIMMPGRNGVQVLAELRRSAELAATPVVLMSGRCGEAEGERFAKINGLAGFLEKPIDPLALIAFLDSVLAGR